MKEMFQRVASLYAANGKFHMFANAMLVGLGTGVSSALVGGIPPDKKGWLVAGGVVVGALKAELTAWLRSNAFASVQGVAATPAQAADVAAAKTRLAAAARSVSR